MSDSEMPGIFRRDTANVCFEILDEEAGAGVTDLLGRTLDTPTLPQPLLGRQETRLMKEPFRTHPTTLLEIALQRTHGHPQ